MQASIKSESDGTVNLQLDAEAARAVFACVVFASRFHEGLTPLAMLAAERLKVTGSFQRKEEEESYANDICGTRKETQGACCL